jgi:hypothetical protein
MFHLALRQIGTSTTINEIVCNYVNERQLIAFTNSVCSSCTPLILDNLDILVVRCNRVNSKCAGFTGILSLIIRTANELEGS